MNAVGFQFVHPTHGPLTISGHPLFNGTNKFSSFYQAENSNSEQVTLHENLVHAVMKGEDIAGFIPQVKPRVKATRTGNTKKDKAIRVIAELTGTDVSNTRIIKAIATKIHSSFGTASTLFYAIRKEAEAT